MALVTTIFFRETGNQEHWPVSAFGEVLVWLLLLFLAGYAVYRMQRFFRREKRLSLADKIDDPADIVSVIRKAMSQKIRFRVRLNERRRSFVSLPIQVTQRSLLIDALFPTEGNELIEHSNLITIDFMLRESEHELLHIPYMFTSSYIRRETVKKYPALRITFPESVTRVQRRSYLRVDPPINKPLYVHYTLESGEEKVQIANISGGGIGFYTNHGKPVLRPGRTLDPVHISIAGYCEITTSLIIHTNSQSERPVLIEGKPYYSFCGAEFGKMEEPVREQVIRYVIEKERDELKRLSRGFD